MGYGAAGILSKDPLAHRLGQRLQSFHDHALPFKDAVWHLDFLDMRNARLVQTLDLAIDEPNAAHHPLK